MNDDIFPVPEKAPPNTQDTTTYQMDGRFFIVFNDALTKWQEIAAFLQANDLTKNSAAAVTQLRREICGLPEGPAAGVDIEYKNLFKKIVDCVDYVYTVVERKKNQIGFDPKAPPEQDKSYGAALYSALNSLQYVAKELQTIWMKKLSYPKRLEVEKNIPVKIFDTISIK